MDKIEIKEDATLRKRHGLFNLAMVNVKIVNANVGDLETERAAAWKSLYA